MVNLVNRKKEAPVINEKRGKNIGKAFKFSLQEEEKNNNLACAVSEIVLELVSARRRPKMISHLTESANVHSPLLSALKESLVVTG